MIWALQRGVSVSSACLARSTTTKEGDRSPFVTPYIRPCAISQLPSGNQNNTLFLEGIFGRNEKFGATFQNLNDYIASIAESTAAVFVHSFVLIRFSHQYLNSTFKNKLSRGFFFDYYHSLF